MLLENPKIEVNHEDCQGNSALYLACKRNRIKVVELLLHHHYHHHQQFPEKVVDLNRIHPYKGRTPLMIATEKGHVGVVEMLLRHENIDINAGLHYYKLPFEVALENGYVKIVQLFLALSNPIFPISFHPISSKMKKVIDEENSAKVLTLIVLITADYLKVSNQSWNQCKGFFIIATNLPLELQMLLCNLLFRISKIFIPEKRLHQSLYNWMRA